MGCSHCNKGDTNLLRLDDTSEVVSPEGGGRGGAGEEEGVKVGLLPPHPSLVRNLFTLRLEPWPVMDHEALWSTQDYPRASPRGEEPHTQLTVGDRPPKPHW